MTFDNFNIQTSAENNIFKCKLEQKLGVFLKNAPKLQLLTVCTVQTCL